MTVYLLETDAENDVVFYQDGMAKIMDFAPSGMLAGVVDLYGDNVVEELKKYFSQNAGTAEDFWSMVDDEIKFDLIKDDGELTIVYND